MAIGPINQSSGSHLLIHYDDGYLEQKLEMVYDTTLIVDYSAITDSTEFTVEFEKVIEK